MYDSAPRSQSNIQHLVDQICSCRQISRSDQQHLMASLLSKRVISRDDQIQIQRITEAIQTGRVRIVD